MQIRIKHLLDRTFAAVLVILLFPLFLVIAIAINLDDGGPVFFRQDRLGQSTRIFCIWKFRTMVVHANRHLDEQGRVTGRGRITRVGRVLRYLSLDELPQVINIVKDVL